MITYLKVPLFAALMAAACSQEKTTNDTATARDTARPPAAHDMSKMSSPEDTSGMAGMDHSSMSGAQPGAAAMTHTMPAGQSGTMTGMDHSQMPSSGAQGSASAAMDHSRMQAGNARSGSMSGMDHSAMTQPSRASQSMAGMDHSKMNMPSTQRSATSGSTSGMPNHTMPTRNPAQPSAGDPHAGMVMTPGSSAQPSSPDPHAGMEMGEPAEPPLPDDVAMEKLRALVAELVRDPKVLARIQADPTLRVLWEDPGVRQYLLKRP